MCNINNQRVKTMKLISISAAVTLSTAAIGLCALSATAAISLDRTRIIVEAESPSVSLTMANESHQLPYLAQGWIEDQQGRKVNSPFTVLPPVQRIDAGDKSQIKIQSLPPVNLLAQDRESLFYFNLREIPPRSGQPNTLQIALQTKIKLFYRPAALRRSSTQLTSLVQQQVTLARKGDRYQIHNPTGYFITLIDARRPHAEETISGFEPVMVSPFSAATLGGSAAALGDEPVLQYINDFGGRSTLAFHCRGAVCQAVERP
ncbi:fimbria/pilus periplasmic chaperone [Erwinia persicina]|nr:fimbria/pilus periplasmic chaperone [Erwinia persicina]